MSIHLHSNNYCSKQYSTKPSNNQIQGQSRIFHQYSQQKGNQTSRVKAYNLNDQQRRIKRQYSSLYKQSTSQSSLFSKGVKKITPVLNQSKVLEKQNTIKRSYRNKQTYNVVNPTPITETKLNEGGIRKIYLYDQNKQSNKTKENCQSRKKIIKNPNSQSQVRQDANIYLIKKLPTHKNAPTQWYNQTTMIHFSKKENIVNKQNLNSQKGEEKNKKNHRQKTMNLKNQSHFTAKQTGITLKEDGKQSRCKNEPIDFNQNYYKRQNWGQKRSYHSNSGFLSYRKL